MNCAKCLIVLLFCKYVVVMVSAGNWYSIKKKSYCDKEITFVMIVKCLLGLRAVNKKKKEIYILLFFFATKFRLFDDFEQMSEIGRCFGLNLFENFFEKLRSFEISIIGRKYCRCRRADH